MVRHESWNKRLTSVLVGDVGAFIELYYVQLFSLVILIVD